ADICPLVKALANSDAQTPQADVVRHRWPAHGTKEDGIEVFELVEAIFRHHAASTRIVVAAPVEVFPIERKCPGGVFGQSTKHVTSCFDHFVAHSIGWNRGNFKSLRSHVSFPCPLSGCDTFHLKLADKGSPRPIFISPDRFALCLRI